MENIANTDCTIDANNNASVSITSPASTKSKANGKGIYRGTINVSVAGAFTSTCTQTAPFPSTISPTAIKTKADGQAVIREGDSGSATVAGVLSGGGTCSITVNFSIDDAGQDKAKGQ